jgi:DNA-binding MarR family transcriptional regulator
MMSSASRGDTGGGEQRAGVAGMDLWRAAMHWRRVIEAELTDFDLTLAQWLVLHALSKLIATQGDAVSQVKVAADLEMDRVTVSQIMRLLDRRGLVSRGPDLTGPALRIWVTAAGARLLARATPRFEAASARALRQVNMHEPVPRGAAEIRHSEPAAGAPARAVGQEEHGFEATRKR